MVCGSAGGAGAETERGTTCLLVLWIGAAESDLDKLTGDGTEEIEDKGDGKASAGMPLGTSKLVAEAEGTLTASEAGLADTEGDNLTGGCVDKNPGGTAAAEDESEGERRKEEAVGGFVTPLPFVGCERRAAAAGAEGTVKTAREEED